LLPGVSAIRSQVGMIAAACKQIKSLCPTANGRFVGCWGGCEPQRSRFYRDCVQILKRLEDATRQFRAEESQGGRLKVGLAPSMSRRMLLREIPAFAQQFPEIESSGLSLVAVEGTDISLPAKEITIAEVLHDVGYATAIFGKWHLGAQTYSQPQNKGFDEFYGIPPAVTWDAFLMVPQGRQTKTLDIPLDRGPQIVEAKRGEPLKVLRCGSPAATLLRSRSHGPG
jgi:hypothetical protein